MKRSVDLAAERGGLRLEIESGARPWCRCYLMPEARPLGGYSNDYVLEHLLAALAKPEGEAGDGPISWVLSLAAPHTSFYTKISAGRQHLLLEDVDGSTFAELTLGPDERRQWIATLQAAAAI